MGSQSSETRRRLTSSQRLEGGLLAPAGTAGSAREPRIHHGRPAGGTPIRYTPRRHRGVVRGFVRRSARDRHRCSFGIG